MSLEEKAANELDMICKHKSARLGWKERVDYNLERMTKAELQAIYQLRTVRKKLKMNRRQLAEKLEVSEATLKNWEAGANRMRQPKILELALRYLTNTYAVRTPLPGLANVVREIQEEEQKRHEEGEE